MRNLTSLPKHEETRGARSTSTVVDVHAPPLQLGGCICSLHSLAFSTSPSKLSDFHLHDLPAPFTALGNPRDAFSLSLRSKSFAQHVSSSYSGFCDSRSWTCAPTLTSPFDASHHESNVLGNFNSSPQLFPKSAKHQYINIPNSTHCACLLYFVQNWQQDTLVVIQNSFTEK